jgi:Tfp pilus assembly protein PilV
MPRIPSRPYPSRLARRLREDDGFGLIEVLVSAVLLVALALATFSLIDKTSNASAQTRAKSLAADIAHDDLNRMRQLKFSLIAGQDYQSKSSQTAVDGVTYAITSTAQWATDSGVETSCTTPTVGGSSQYLRIRSSVTWPNNKGNPVVADSILAPRGKEANRTTGALMVKVQNASAQPVSGALVSVASQSLTTSAAGCVYFPAVAAGQWPVTIAKSASPDNYMDSDGNSPGKANASIVVGDVSTVSVSFDIPAKLNPVKIVNESGGAGPSWFTLSATSQGKVVSSATQLLAKYSSFNINKVFPFKAGWAFYAGNCAGNNPALYSSDFTTKAPSNSVLTNPGTTVSTGLAYMRQISFTITNKSSRTDTFNWKIQPDTSTTWMADCKEAVGGTTSVSLPSNGSATVGPIDIPYGVWSICAETSSYAPNSSRYAWATYNDYNLLPSVPGTTRKTGTGYPTNSTGTASPSGTGSGTSVDKC